MSFFSSMFGPTHSFGFDDYGPDRSGWRDKSDAAARRERQAQHLFDQFLHSVAENDPTTSFPLTQDVIPPEVHLTGACYTSFRKYVASKGCTAKRREATPTERSNLSTKDRRSAKMYVVRITVPVHPAQAMENERRNKEAAAKRDEKKREAEQKARIEAERKRKLEHELDEKTKQEYASVVSYVMESSSTTVSVEKENVVPETNNNHDDNDDDDDVKESPKKRLKTTGGGPLLAITVPQARILQHAQEMLEIKKVAIHRQMDVENMKERLQILRELAKKYQEKKEAEMKKAQEHCDRIKKAIMDAGEQ
jgi:hypothetical protein